MVVVAVFAGAVGRSMCCVVHFSLSLYRVHELYTFESFTSFEVEWTRARARTHCQPISMSPTTLWGVFVCLCECVTPYEIAFFASLYFVVNGFVVVVHLLLLFLLFGLAVSICSFDALFRAFNVLIHFHGRAQYTVRIEWNWSGHTIAWSDDVCFTTELLPVVWVCSKRPYGHVPPAHK